MKHTIYIIFSISWIFSIANCMETASEDNFEYNEIELSEVHTKMASIINHIDNGQSITQDFFSQIKDTYHTVNKENSRQSKIFLIVLMQHTQIDDKQYESPAIQSELLKWMLENNTKRKKVKTPALAE